MERDEGVAAMKAFRLILGFLLACSIFAALRREEPAVIGIFNIVMLFLLVWYVGQHIKGKEALNNMVVGEKAKGQWER